MTDEDGFSYTYEHDVRFEETDAQGVVFFGNYVTFMDEAVLNYWREIGHPYDGVLDEGWEVFVVHAEVDYRTSTRYGDRLRHGVRVGEIGTSSLTFEYRCLRDGEVVAEGGLVQVAVDADGEPMPVPEAIVEAIDSYQSTPPTRR